MMGDTAIQIVTDSLPRWCQLHKFPLDMTPSDALPFAKERINRLSSGERWNLNSSNPDEIIREFAGHILLRVAVAADIRLSAWFVEFEGDLFDFRFGKATESEIMSVIHYFFGDYVKELTHIELEYEINLKKKYGLFERQERRINLKKEYKGRNIVIKKFQRIPEGIRKYIGIHFTRVPEIISKHKALLFQGWAIAPVFVFRLPIKRAFENRLREKLKEIKEKIMDDPSLKPIIRELRSHIRSKHQHFRFPTPRSTVTTGQLFQRPEVFPECMRQLISILDETGHLEHGYRFQLGTFLKNLGMRLEDQKHFWFAHAVDNVGKDFAQFDAKVGYLISHLYGKEGSGVDYNTPSCETIITSYFCPLSHQEGHIIVEKLKKESLNEEKSTSHDHLLEDIDKHLLNNNPRAACAKIFELRYGKRARKIKHPLSYVRFASKTLKEKNSKKS